MYKMFAGIVYFLIFSLSVIFSLIISSGIAFFGNLIESKMSASEIEPTVNSAYTIQYFFEQQGIWGNVFWVSFPLLIVSLFFLMKKRVNL